MEQSQAGWEMIWYDTSMLSTSTKPQTFLRYGTYVVGVLTVGAQLGQWHWLGDIFALVVDFYLSISVLLLFAFLLRKSWRWVSVASILVLITSYQLTSFPSVEPTRSPEIVQNVRLLAFNIYYLNKDLDAVIAMINRYDPDIVFLMEYSYDVQQQIEPAFAHYPYRLIQPSRFTMGLALFSRIPFDSTAVHRFEATRIPIYQVQLNINGKPFSFVGGHPWPPQPQWGELHRNQMQEIMHVIEHAPPPLLVVGDFNAAPWSYSMEQLAEQGNLQLIRQRLDVTKTWYPLPGFGLPLDHILVSEEWQVLQQQYGAPSGSDHVPLIVDLHLP